MIRRQKKGPQVRVTFALPQGSVPGKVSVVGDFNGWIPGATPLVKRTNGTQSAVVSLPEGTVHRFRYLGENGHWFDDPEADIHTHEGGVLHV
jgi:1,4-alpha-glucan branching enzyme